MPGSHKEEHLPWLWHFQNLKIINWNYLNCLGKDPKSFVARFYPLCWIVHPRITSYSTYSNLSETFLSVVESLMMGDVVTWVPVRIRLTMSTQTTFDIVAAIINKIQDKSLYKWGWLSRMFYIILSQHIISCEHFRLYFRNKFTLPWIYISSSEQLVAYIVP